VTVWAVDFADDGFVVGDEIGDELDVFAHQIFAQGECFLAVAGDEVSTEPCGEEIGENGALDHWGIVGEDFGNPPDQFLRLNDVGRYFGGHVSNQSSHCTCVRGGRGSSPIIRP